MRKQKEGGKLTRLLSQEENDRRIKLYKTGMSDSEIGAEVGVTRYSIRHWRNGRGLIANKSKQFITNVEKKKIKILHTEKNTISEIAMIIGRSGVSVREYCKRNNLDTSRGRAFDILYKRKWGIDRRDILSLYEYLEEYGPTARSDLLNSGFTENGLSKVYVYYPDDIEQITLGRGSRASKYKSSDIFINEYIGFMFYSIKGDNRVVDYIADKIMFKPKNHYEAKAVFVAVKRHVGDYRGRLIIERLGYKYKKTKIEMKQ